ncbi:adenosylcobinamide-GDP ribazoletransferase [Sphingomonas sp. H39-1-10]|uniref:adenosylcobinamide-GDP ribazoletransferase n=1 Tax=Sphingomonas pollutisoli TaxID=3030829 RepID=UPI0023B96DB7|nr:adenosylcobinamide-GDP ribazoletransferase [Sphingomonas pollutisoli]MDF0488725.1 adenosylcobinamide-GDP ribazoletransferase [Sphingomonas pollutisoli]
MTGLLLAIQFLTRLPTPAVAANETAFAASIRWFPLVGLLIGALVASAGWLGRGDAWIGALAALAVWIGVTGALHLDGLADLADARGAAHGDRARLLAVLADPHVGSFGVVALVLQIIAKLVLLHTLIGAGQWGPLVLIPFAARLGPLVWTRWLPPLHAGLASRFRTAVRRIDIVVWAAVSAGAGLVWVGVLVTPVLLVGWALYLRRALGGISGDGHGAGIELVETALLVAATL